MTTPHRVTTNSRPLDYTRIERTRDYSGTLRLTAWSALGLFAFGLLLWGLG